MARPNIILIFPDQWRADCLSIAGHSVVRTPFVDTLAQQGVRFTSAYTPSPTCIPARASLLTGQSPALCGRQGYRDKVPWTFDDTFVTRLNEAGYQTINVGKTHFYPQGVSLGFEVNRGYEPQYLDNGYESDYHKWLRETTGGRVQDTARTHSNNTWVPMPWPYEEYLHPTNWTVDTALEALTRRDASRPCFVQVGLHRPHPPYDPPWPYYAAFQHRELPPIPVGDWAEEWADRPVDANSGTAGKLPDDVQNDSRRAYFAEINHLDHQIGKLTYALKRLGMADNTWLIFVSDHGEMLGDHHRRHKIGAWEGSAAIPLIVCPPPGSAEWGRGAECGTPVTLTDLAPTILEVAEASVPDGMDSRSLAPLLRADPPADFGREFVHGEHAPAMHFVTDGCEKLIWNSFEGGVHFFDLSADPEETRDRSEDPAYADRVELWKRRLAETLAAPHRREDGLSDGERLIPGTRLPPVRESAGQGC